MSEYNPSFDAYIEKSNEFAKPILNHIRELIHKVCPEVTEKMKWSMPFFDYKDEMMCHMAAFKQHAVLGFWKAKLMSDPLLQLTAESETSMGHLGKIMSLKDLPADKKLGNYIREAMRLNDQGIKMPAKPKPADKHLDIPDDFEEAVAKNKKAKATFDGFSYSCKKEYVQWITEAKTDATRVKRLKEAVAMMSEGKSRHWKYK